MMTLRYDSLRWLPSAPSLTSAIVTFTGYVPGGIANTSPLPSMTNGSLASSRPLGTRSRPRSCTVRTCFQPGTRPALSARNSRVSIGRSVRACTDSLQRTWRHCPRPLGLELQVEAECVVDLHHQVGRYAADHGTYPLDRDRTHLFGLGLGGLVDPRLSPRGEGWIPSQATACAPYCKD